MNKLDPRNIYDDLHQIPELGFEEFKTSAYLADKLEAMGYKVTRNIGGTGVIGEIKGSEPGPVMMLRADMDALPFLIDGEKKNIHAGNTRTVVASYHRAYFGTDHNSYIIPVFLWQFPKAGSALRKEIYHENIEKR